jgi:hypothetical protein
MRFIRIVRDIFGGLTIAMLVGALIALPILLIGGGLAMMLGIMPDWAWEPTSPAVAHFISGAILLFAGSLTVTVFLSILLDFDA